MYHQSKQNNVNKITLLFPNRTSQLYNSVELDVIIVETVLKSAGLTIWTMELTSDEPRKVQLHKEEPSSVRASLL